jgi:hypothetical protein
VSVGGLQRGEPFDGAARAGLRQTEVEQLRARLGDHHVARLQIAMDDPGPVRCVER